MKQSELVACSRITNDVIWTNQKHLSCKIKDYSGKDNQKGAAKACVGMLSGFLA